MLLGLVDHKRIAGLSKWVHDEDLAMGAKEAKDVTKIAESNPEAILALKPDLVLLPDSSKPEQISSLEDVGIKVFVYPAASRLSNIPKTIKAIGGAVGETEQAEKLIAEMQKKISAVEAKVKKMQPEDRKKGLLFLRFGAIGGKGIIFNDIMTAAGVEDCYEAARHTIADKPGTSRILSKEEVVQANPDYIIIATWSQGGAYKAGNAQLEELYADPALATVTAVKKKQAIVIPQGYVNCLSQHAADSVELLHEAVYGK
ncbi:periplasmic binding protein [Phascolarctobacterium succinatutens YIT 12067]|uniref:Periplasmic binding protein n=1 Tax=Phascolarctobacterium succinatutens YIT 12067 TaxID=626939 RepID=E8LDS2_9FIRM|nr:periplasmic binding protein [Phascolarctobacterium succinatutens YIT 12067]